MVGCDYNRIAMASGHPVPPELEPIRAFVNTRNVESGADELATPAAFARWLEARGLSTGDATERERALAVELREALRALLLGNQEGKVPPVAVARLNRMAAELGYTLAFDERGLARPVPAGRGPRAALARLLAGVLIAQSDGTWPRLKACRSDTCQWAYYDGSKNRSGKWCDMAVCGNRMKARRHRKRAAAAPARRPRRT